MVTRVDSQQQHRCHQRQELMTSAELAAYLKVPLPTAYIWRTRGKAPPATRVGRHTRYRREDVERWLSTGQSSPSFLNRPSEGDKLTGVATSLETATKREIAEANQERDRLAAEAEDEEARDAVAANNGRQDDGELPL